jgi:hypothetical protein
MTVVGLSYGSTQLENALANCHCRAKAPSASWRKHPAIHLFAKKNDGCAGHQAFSRRLQRLCPRMTDKGLRQATVS